MRLWQILVMSGLMANYAMAGMVEVTPANGASFSLDIDGDGWPEVDSFVFDPASESLWAGFWVDGTAEVSSFADDVFVGVSGVGVATMDQLVEAKGFATEFTAPTSTERNPAYDPIGGSIFLNEDKPLVAIWSYGSSGTGSAPTALVGYVVDAREHFTSGLIAPVQIYYHNYGPVVGGAAPRWVSLEDTGVPLGEQPALAAASEFPDPRVVRFTVASEIGKIYRIIRKSSSGTVEAVVEREGTGASLTLEWDDRPRGQSAAFFSLEEFGGEAFSPSI
jgi:hypothetical protein